MNSDRQIQEALATLVASHAEAEWAIDELTNALGIQKNRSSGDDIPRLQNSRSLIADCETLSVVWNDKTCFLGNTLLFRFFERLARSPNRYVPHSELLEDVWGGVRDMSTIRGVAKRLRDRLREEDMGELADAIDGSVIRHYGLKLV